MRVQRIVLMNQIKNIESFYGSEQESGEVSILCGFSEDEELGLCNRKSLRLQEQIVQVAVATTTA